MVVTKRISLETRGNGDTQDITREVARAVEESGVASGVVTLFCPGSTSALTTIEFEPGAVADLQQVFDETAPRDRYYRHNERWHDGNGHSRRRHNRRSPPARASSSAARCACAATHRRPTRRRAPSTTASRCASSRW
jgi:hypothetical protein